MTLKKQLTIMSLILSIVLVVSGIYVLQSRNSPTPTSVENDHEESVHVHSDFAMYINNSRVNLTADKYQSTTYDRKHLSFHLHDGVDTMLHRHADGITLSEFMDSLGFTFTNECITTDTKEEFCGGEEKVLRLYVNGQIQENPSEYITQEEDKILLYYGKDNPKQITELLESITDEACIYSGNCPERGEPPYESCALRCEL